MAFACVFASNLLIPSLVFAGDPVTNCYEIEFNGVEYHGNDTSTWTYTISRNQGCEGPYISHWVWQPCFSLEDLEDIL